jgi:hypothetical protein
VNHIIASIYYDTKQHHTFMNCNRSVYSVFAVPWRLLDCKYTASTSSAIILITSTYFRVCNTKHSFEYYIYLSSSTFIISSTVGALIAVELPQLVVLAIVSCIHLQIFKDCIELQQEQSTCCQQSSRSSIRSGMKTFISMSSKQSNGSHIIIL